MEEEEREEHAASVAELPAYLKALLGKIKPLEFKNEDIKEDNEDGMAGGNAQWGGAYCQGPWDGSLAIYEWN